MSIDWNKCDNVKWCKYWTHEEREVQKSMESQDTSWSQSVIRNHKLATRRCSSQDLWQRSEKNYQKSCPWAKDHSWRTSEKPGISTTQDSTAEEKAGWSSFKVCWTMFYKPVKYWENIVWSDETKIELYGCHDAMFGGLMVLHITPKTSYQQWSLEEHTL